MEGDDREGQPNQPGLYPSLAPAPIKLPIADVFAIMCSGSEFKKYGRRGNPAKRNVILNRAQTHIVYNSSKKNVQDAAISIPEIVCVKTGIEAGNFLRFPQLAKKGEVKSLCITIVYARPDPNISNKLKRLNELIDPSSGKEEQIHYRAEWIALKTAERSYQRNPANQMTLDLCAPSIYQQNVWLNGLRELILQQKVKDDTRIEELRAREGSPIAAFVPPPYISPALQPHPIPQQQQLQHFSPLPPAVNEEHASSAADVQSPPMQLPLGYEPPGGPLLMYEPGGMPPPNAALIMMGEAEDADIDAEGNLVDRSAARAAASSSSHSPRNMDSASAAAASMPEASSPPLPSPPPLPVSPRPSMAAFQVLIPDAQSSSIEDSPGYVPGNKLHQQQRSANPSPFVGPGATPLPAHAPAAASSSSSSSSMQHHHPLQQPPPSALHIPLYPSLEPAQPSPGPVPNAAIVMIPAIGDTPMHANRSHAAASSSAQHAPAERPSIKVVTPVVELPDDINTLMTMACASKLNGVANWDINLKIVGIVSSYNKQQLNQLFDYSGTFSQLLRSDVHSTALLALILFESLYENCPNVRSVKSIQHDTKWMQKHLLKMIPRWSRKPRSPVSFWQGMFSSSAEKQHRELLRAEQSTRIPMLRWSKTKIIIASIANERASGIHWFAAFNKMKQAGAYDNLNRDIQVALDQAVALQVVNEQQRPLQVQQQQQPQQQLQQPQAASVRSPQEAKRQQDQPRVQNSLAMPLKPVPGMLDTNLANFNQHLSMLSSSLSALSDQLQSPTFQSDVFQQQQAKYQSESLERTHAQLKRDLAQVTSGAKPAWVGEEQIAQMFNMSEFLHESQERYNRCLASVAAASSSSSSSSFAPAAPLSASSLREHKESDEKQQANAAKPALAVSDSFLLSPPRSAEHIDSPHALVPAVAIPSEHLISHPPSSSQRSSFIMEQDEKQQSSASLSNVSRPLGVVASAPTATPAFIQQYLAQAAAERQAAQQQVDADVSEAQEQYSVISPASVGEPEVVSPPDYLHVPRIHRASESVSEAIASNEHQEDRQLADVEHAPHELAEPVQAAAVVAAEEDESKLVAQDKKKEKKKKKKQAAASERAVVLM